MARSERLLSLLQVLRRHRRPVSGATLAAELGVSIRTLYRDIATLQAQGAEIHGEAGLGYMLKPGFTLPPLMFSVDEIEALVLGVTWVSRRTDDRLGEAAENAVAKIRSVLPSELREYVDASALTVPPVWNSVPLSVDLTQIRLAMRAETKISIGYRDANDQVSHRTLWPFLVGFFDRVLLLVAWCELRRDYRSFRIDRITELQRLEERYPRRRAEMATEWRARLTQNAADKN